MGSRCASRSSRWRVASSPVSRASSARSDVEEGFEALGAGHLEPGVGFGKCSLDFSRRLKAQGLAETRIRVSRAENFQNRAPRRRLTAIASSASVKAVARSPSPRCAAAITASTRPSAIESRRSFPIVNAVPRTSSASCHAPARRGARRACRERRGARRPSSMGLSLDPEAASLEARVHAVAVGTRSTTKPTRRAGACGPRACS